MGDTIATTHMNTRQTKNTKHGDTTVFETLKTDYVYTNNLDTRENDDGYHDFQDGYPDDFEDIDEYNSSDDDITPPQRLTKKAGEKEMDEVRDYYKDFLKGENPEMAKAQQLSTINEQCIESSGGTNLNQSNTQTRALKTMAEQKPHLKERCIEQLGKERFEEIYKYLSIHRAKGTDDQKVQIYNLFEGGETLEGEIWEEGIRVELPCRPVHLL